MTSLSTTMTSVSKKICVATVAFATAAALAAPGARASISITSSQIVLDTGSARAVVQRAPFRLSFTDERGVTVLSEVPNTVPSQPTLSVDAEPGGLRNTPRVQPLGAAPLTFEIGAALDLQEPLLQYEGNQVAAAHGGVSVRPEVVIAVGQDAGGVRLTVSTDDPTRSLSVLLEPDGTGAIRVIATPRGPAGANPDVTSIGDAFISPPGEQFHGFGGRHNAIDQAGQDFYNWIEQENYDNASYERPIVDSLPGSGGDRYQFPNGPTAAYYAQSEFVSSRRYGFLLNTPTLSRFTLAAKGSGVWQVSALGDTLDYTVAVGPAPTVIAALTEITGRQPEPPAWAQGVTLSRTDRIFSANSDNISSYKAEVLSDLSMIQKLKLPISAYAYELWYGLGDSFDRSVNQRLIAAGIHPEGYVRAFVSDDGELSGNSDASAFDSRALFEQAVQNNYVADRAPGVPYIYAGSVGPTALIDFTNPAAVAWWKGRIFHMLDLGFDGFMQDFGEQVMNDMVFCDPDPAGKCRYDLTGSTFHQQYPIVYDRVTREIIDQYMAQHPGRQIFFYTRAGASGRPGDAAYENGNFPGDESADWQQSSGLPSVTRDMLNRGVLGAWGYNVDIGGYSDFNDGPTSKELYIRWVEWAALSPYWREHNDASTGVKRPWSYDDQTLSIWRQMAALHAAALPYIRRVWRQSERSGMPLNRPLWLVFPDDQTAAKQDEEWMVGPDVLVAPVVTQGATSVNVYFPGRGTCWQDPQTGRRYAGGRTQTVAAPLDKLPYFFVCGTRPFTLPGLVTGPALGGGGGSRAYPCSNGVHGSSVSVCDPSGQFSSSQQQGYLAAGYDSGSQSLNVDACNGAGGPADYGLSAGTSPGYRAGSPCPDPNKG